MKITWLGHSCFKIESGGYCIITDPYEDGSVPGLGPVREQADAVLCSHGHGDHGAAHLVSLRKGAPCPFTIETIDTYHDDKRGALRGENKIHILDDGKFRVAHMGDLGCDLTAEQKNLLRGLSALLIPVGGYYTIDAHQAKALIDELAPAAAIPMHYRHGIFGFDAIGTLEQFTDLCDNVSYQNSHELELTDGAPQGIVVLTPKNAK